MTTDTLLRQKVLDALEWEPSVDANNIGVSVNNGIVTLNGHVKTYAEKLAAEQCVQGLSGVRAVAQDIEVRLDYMPKTDDDQIAERAARILEWSNVPDKIKVKVEKGWITLNGEVDWYFQRNHAEDLVSHLSAVRGISNLIKVKERVQPGNIKLQIEDALKRSALLHASKIQVSAKDGEVTISGSVPTLYEKQVARGAVWAAPGVRRVVDNLHIN